MLRESWGEGEGRERGLGGREGRRGQRGGNQVERCYGLSMKSFAFLMKGIAVAGTVPLPLSFAMLNMKGTPELWWPMCDHQVASMRTRVAMLGNAEWEGRTT